MYTSAWVSLTEADLESIYSKTRGVGLKDQVCLTQMIHAKLLQSKKCVHYHLVVNEETMDKKAKNLTNNFDIESLYAATKCIFHQARVGSSVLRGQVAKM